MIHLDEQRLEESLFAAAIVRQVFDFMRDGKGPPSPKDFDRFVEEAEAVTSLAVSATYNADRYSIRITRG